MSVRGAFTCGCLVERRLDVFFEKFAVCDCSPPSQMQARTDLFVLDIFHIGPYLLFSRLCCVSPSCFVDFHRICAGLDRTFVLQYRG